MEIQKSTESDTVDVLKTMEYSNTPVILTMPHIRGTPINEWSGHSIAIDAFSTLFPTGVADLAANRSIDVTMDEWTARLIKYKDNWFAQHPRFRYWALNTIMRKVAKKATYWYLTTHKDECELTVEDIKETINNGNGEYLANRISHAGEKLQES